MALDDVRAISLLLGSAHIEVVAMVTSDGSSSPEAGYHNLQKVLSFLHRDDITVGMGRRLDAPPPPWREISEALGWAELPGPSPPSPSGVEGAVPLILKTLSTSETPLSYVCLGPLANLAEALEREPKSAERIAAVFFYGLPPSAQEPGWNTSRDKGAAERVFSSGVPVYSVHFPPERLLTFDEPLYQEIRGQDTEAARLIDLIHFHPTTQKLLQANHFLAWDETVALCLDDPDLCRFQKLEEGGPVFGLMEWKRTEARRAYVSLLSQSAGTALTARPPVVLAAFPTNPLQFQEDLRPLLPQIIARHGMEEWQTTVLTNELHRHLGIYSIIGAKMGIRAREVLNASLDELAVESFAGLKPPLSCTNDGLQVATGASLGRGTITIVDGSQPKVEAVFSMGPRRLRVSLKDDIKARIRADIQHAIQHFGDLTPGYFKEVRRLSLEYWKELNREDIFTCHLE
jgi:pyrimidine-specific ribonucleoside hydrolase